MILLHLGWVKQGTSSQRGAPSTGAGPVLLRTSHMTSDRLHEPPNPHPHFLLEGTFAEGIHCDRRQRCSADTPKAPRQWWSLPSA